jgi:hypothetical protein
LCFCLFVCLFVFLNSPKRTQKTQALLHGTPAKAKFFSAAIEGSPVGSEPVAQRERAAIGLGDGLAQLEAEEEAKHALQFVRPSLVQPATAAAAVESDVNSHVIVERQRLLCTTSKHCGTCDKIMVKLDQNPSKNRVHMAAFFVLRVSVAALSPKQRSVTLVVSNPMNNVVLAELSPLDSTCRFTLAKPVVLTLPAAPDRAAVKTRVPPTPIVITSEQAPTKKFGVTVTLRYDGVLGKQETRYRVLFSHE